MKKIVLTACAAAALLIGCNRDEIIETNPQNAISFDNAFVDHTTRATEINKENLTEFYVHSVRTNPAGEISDIFKNTRVYREGTAPENYVYKYDDTRYWFDGSYEFLACNMPMPITVPNEQQGVSLQYGNDGLLNSGKLTYNPLDPEKDLITAFATRAVSGNATTGTEKLSLTFNHLMSEVAFEITNSLGNAYHLEINKTSEDALCLNLNSPEYGAYYFADKNWVQGINGTWSPIDFAPEDITIPGDPGTSGREHIFESVSKFMFPTSSGTKLTLHPSVRIAIEFKDGGLVQVLEVKDSEEGKVLDGIRFEPGKKYLIKMNITPEVINAQTIEFDVFEVEDFKYPDFSHQTGGIEEIQDDHQNKW